MREQTSLAQRLFQVRESISRRQTKSRIRFVSVAFVSDSSDLQCDTVPVLFPPRLPQTTESDFLLLVTAIVYCSHG